MIGGDNLPSPFGIGLTDLPIIGRGSGPPAPPPGSSITVASSVKVMKSQNEYMESSYCPKYKQNIREISALEVFKD